MLNIKPEALYGLISYEQVEESKRSNKLARRAIKAAWGICFLLAGIQIALWIIERPWNLS